MHTPKENSVAKCRFANYFVVDMPVPRVKNAEGNTLAAKIHNDDLHIR